MMVLIAVHWLPASWFYALLSSLLILGASLVVVRRLAFKRFVELDEGELLLPVGFLRLRMIRIPCNTIVSIQESACGVFGTALWIRAGDRHYDISWLDKDDCVAVGEFLQTVILNNRKATVPVLGEQSEVTSQQAGGAQDEFAAFSQMSLIWHIKFFLKTYVFSPRIFCLTLFDLVFWILVFTGCRLGIQRGIDAHSWSVGLVAGLVGFLLGMVAGILFLGFFYLLYCRDVSRKTQHHKE